MFSQDSYIKEVAPKLKEILKKDNVNALPKLKKISVNVGAGKMSVKDKKIVQEIADNLRDMTGQKPVIRNSRISISNFKLREGYPVGVSVSLRGQRMYDFLNRVINVVFPRIRDFQGFSIKSFDKKGNLTIGIKEHTVFPEINQDDIVQIHGVQITFNIDSESDRDSYELLKLYGFPFKEKEFNKKS